MQNGGVDGALARRLELLGPEREAAARREGPLLLHVPQVGHGAPSCRAFSFSVVQAGPRRGHGLAPTRGAPGAAHSARDSGRRGASASPRPRVRRLSGGFVSRHAPPPLPSDGGIARARPRDAALARGLRLPAVRVPGRGCRAAARRASQHRPALGRPPLRRGGGRASSGRSSGAALRHPGGERRGSLRRLRRRRDRPAHRAGAPRARARPRGLDRRLPLRVHVARALRRRRGGRDPERRIARAAREDGGQPCRGRCGRRLPQRHDGRQGGRHPGLARCGGLRAGADRRLLRQVRLGLLRPLPRSSRVGAGVR